MNRAQEARDRAAAWLVAREEPDWDASSTEAFEAWLAESDMNRVAFLRLEHSWREADRLGSLGPAMEQRDLQSDQLQIVNSGRARRWMTFAIAASMLIAVGLGSYEFTQRVDSGPTRAATSLFHTKVGGRETVALQDGSKVELNTASVVRTDVDDRKREVWLDQGEAYFDVAHDKSRPFVVHAGNREITVLGTKFSVRRDGDNVSVFVREGRVRVDYIANSVAVRSTTITGGDVAVTRGSATLVTAKSEDRVEGALSWREGILTFNQQPLSAVAAEFNRYNRQQLIIVDREAAEIRIGGMFPAAKPADFGRVLHDAYGLRVEETPDAIRISS